MIGHSKEDVSVQQALEAIALDNKRARADGLRDLKHVLLENRHTGRLNSLRDKDFHRIFEVLFRSIASEKSQYARARSAITKNSCATRLTACASSLRVTVELGVRKIKYKTLSALISHITEVLAIDYLWEPLGDDYVKTLRAVLDYPPHMEHLQKHDWKRILGLCLSRLKGSEDEIEDEENIENRARPMSASESESRASSVEPMTPRQLWKPGLSAKDNNRLLSEIVDILEIPCSCPSAAIGEEAPTLLDGLLQYLTSDCVSKAPRGALAAMNALLVRTAPSNVSLVQKALLRSFPIICSFWSTNSILVKEELLVMLDLARIIVPCFRDPVYPELLDSSVASIVEYFEKQYLELPASQRLQSSDIILSLPDCVNPMGVRGLAPHLGMRHAEHGWVIVRTVARFSLLLDGRQFQSSSMNHGYDDEFDLEPPTKKHSRQSRMFDILRDAYLASGSPKIFALQLLSILIAQDDIPTEQLSFLLERLMMQMSDPNVQIASWTVIAISSIAGCPYAASQELNPIWCKTWELLPRTISSPGTAMTGFHLMATMLHQNLVNNSVTNDIINLMPSSVEFIGPARLTDSSILLWKVVMISRRRSNVSQNKVITSQICQWLKSTWAVKAFKSEQYASSCRITELLSLLVSCVNRSFDFPHAPFAAPLSRISQFWFHRQMDIEPLSYLLLSKEQSANDLGVGMKDSQGAGFDDSSSQLVLELLQDKLSAFAELWASLSTEAPQDIKGGIIQAITILCNVSSIFMEVISPTLQSVYHNMKNQIKKLWCNMCTFFSTREQVNAALDALAPLVLSIKPPLDFEHPILKALGNLSPQLLGVFQKVCTSVSKDEVAADDDINMDGSDVTSISRFDREDIPFPVFCDVASVRIATVVHLTVFLRAKSSGQTSLQSVFPLFDYLLSLKEEEILVYKFYLSSLIESQPSMSLSDANEVFISLTEKCLNGYNLQRCEGISSICTTLINSFAYLWVPNVEHEINEAASSLFDWFTETVVGKGIASSKILVRVATFIEEIMTINPDFSRGPSKPSPRTHFFNIMRKGDLSVKFKVAKLVPSIFKRFPTREHDIIFSDVLDNLPNDPEWNEGIAFRLLLLGRLGSRWHTLLRRAVYHIFEIPGRVPNSTPYAKACLQEVSTSLHLDEPKEIFRLFGSQLLCTWLETQTIATIPFSVFGYFSLQDLLLEVQDEVVAQIMLRGKDTEMQELSRILEIPFSELLETSFARVEAYSISRDISMPQEQTSYPPGAEKRVKRLLGEARFMKLVMYHFADIIAIIFQCIDQPEQISRAFMKWPSLSSAQMVWKNLEEKSPSSVHLPPAQQPCFRARYLFDQLSYAAGQLGRTLDNLWIPALVGYVARSLIDGLHPSLKQIRSATIVRKLRILICMAGHIVFEPYIAQIFLSFLVPLMTDIDCSMDATGAVWYIYENRTGAGLNVYAEIQLAFTVLISTNNLLTTHETRLPSNADFVFDASKTSQFLDWFSQFLNSWVVYPKHVDKQRKFQDMVSIARLLPTLNQPRKETAQGMVLLYIMEEGGGEHRMHRNGLRTFLSCLNEGHDITKPFRSSILNSDSEAIDYAESLVYCSICGIAETGYQLWVARVLGRSYAASGKPDIKLLLDDQISVSLDVDFKRPGMNSTLGIMEYLCINAMSDDFRAASLAQHTCQAIASKYDSDESRSQGQNITPQHLIKYFVWRPYACPNLRLSSLELKNLELEIQWNPNIPAREWARNIAIALCLKRPEAPVLGDLPKILYHVPTFAQATLPYIFHDVLLAEQHNSLDIVKREISDVFREAFASDSSDIIPHLRLIIQTILYLRTREFPKEATPEARDHWLDVDYLSAASAAIKCQMYETALLFVEIHCSHPSGKSRRQSSRSPPLPVDTLSSIFERIGDLDLTYGIDREPSLEHILARLQHEDSGMKTLSFQSALYNAELRLSQEPSDDDSLAVIRALNQSSLQCIASSMSSSTGSFSTKTEASETMLSTALDLQKWDLPVDNSHNNSSSTASILNVLQSLSATEDKTQMTEILDSSYLNVLGNIFDRQSTESMRNKMQALAVLTEVDEIMSVTTSDALLKQWDRISSRNNWLRLENFNDVYRLLQCREASFSLINRRPGLRSLLNVSDQNAQLLEFKAARETFRLSKEHGTHLETTLKSAVLLYKMVKPCEQVGISVDAAAKYDLATALWDQGEKVAAVGMLQQLAGDDSLANQTIPVGKAEIFTLLGHYVAETKLEKPEAIINNYLLPSVKELKGDMKGSVPGRVYHEFAVFCDKQFQESAKPFHHIDAIRSRKLQEIDRNREMSLSATPSEKKRLQNERDRARRWLQLDDYEWKRLLNHRSSLLSRCLVNYTLSLAACDDFKNDVIRFFTIWMDNSDKAIANKAVSSGLDKVPSRRFAPLTNQLLSRLADEQNDFQVPLSSLIFRVCVNHPYHSMNHLFMTCRTKIGDDEVTNSRFNAANELSQKLFNDNRTRRTWTRVNNFNSHYVAFATAFTRDEPRKRPTSGTVLRLDQYGKTLIADIETNRLPPPTLSIPLRVDCDYENIPHIAQYSRDFTIAGGISAPKVVDVTTSDGQRHKQLFKAGNDDLRQDAVMEQVFEQVSDLLKDHRSTRQRNLGIRTYKVVPLTPNAGVIEFVKDTMPLNDYLIPAHRKYFPTNYKFSTCRDQMYNAQTRTNEERIQIYRKITANFHPVLRFFFTEQFKEPDVWFSRRIAYTRSTAAISMLGYILGLGDRHLNNILLDKTTGEVVHIDLGVAFEQGRVLPIPEVVPFRLTRDVVDGMGITKTEGVFRRCCEFTLDVLRQECHSVMTILDVLRYDPLCCWTISRVRAKKMQDTQRPTGSPMQKKSDTNKSSDADRALAIVQEKLTTNSIAATVNELIQQSTDERNLAVLYCGWAPFA